jgi:hypothetical protein
MKVYVRFFAGSVALIIILVGTLITSSQAATKSPSSALMAPIITAFNAFNAGNESLWAGVQTANVVILDDLPPYRWDAPNAATKWWADFSAWMKTNKMTKPHVTYQAIQFWEQTGDGAYMVVPTTFTAVQNGKSTTQTGTLTFALVKIGPAWKVQGWTWGTTSMK